MSHSSRYLERGVSSGKEDVHQAIRHLDKGLFPNAFCKVIPDMLTGDPGHCLVMHADGAGTKSSLAYVYWKETGDLSVWKGIAQDAIVMNLDDLLCVGITDNILLSSTIGRNKRKIPGEVISALINGTEEILAQLRDLGISIYSTGGPISLRTKLVRARSFWAYLRPDRPPMRVPTTEAWEATGLPLHGTMFLGPTWERSILKALTLICPASWHIQAAKH